MFHLLLQFCPFFFCQLTPGHMYATPSSGSFRRSMAQSDGVARQHAFAELGMAAVTYLQDVPWEFYSIIRLIYTAIYIYIYAVCVCVYVCICKCKCIGISILYTYLYIYNTITYIYMWMFYQAFRDFSNTCLGVSMV